MYYKEKNIEHNGKVVTLIFEFESGLELLSNFLSSDVSSFEQWIKETFDKVINGESQYECESYNVCSIQVTPITTKVHNELALTDEEYYSTSCEVDTKELRNVIELWCNRKIEFKNSLISEQK